MSATIFGSSTSVKVLKDNLDINGKVSLLTGTVDPTSVATSAPAGSLYLNTSTGAVYTKTDAGSSTNWSVLTSDATLAATVVSKTANYTLTLDDDIVECATAGGAFALSLPSAGSATGKRYTIRKTDSSTNAVTISTWTLKSINETLKLYSNGSSWVREIQIPRNYVLMSSGSGYGSTATCIRYFGNLEVVGSAFTVTQSSVNGDSVEILEDGIYALSRNDGSAATQPRIGFSMNSNQLTTAITSITPSHYILSADTPPSSMGTVAVTVFLPAGSVIRAHDGDLKCDRVDSRESVFKIVQVSK